MADILEPVVAPVESAPAVPVAVEPAPVVSAPEVHAYRGSEDLNPGKFDLAIDTTGWEEGAINSYIRENGEAAFASSKPAEKAEGPKPAEKAEDAPAEKVEEAGADINIEELLKDVGVTSEQLASYPDKVQELIIDSLVGVEPVEKIPEYRRQVDLAEAKVKELTSDPVIAARLEELATGRPLVASATAIASDDFLTAFDTLVSAGKDEEARQLMRSEVAKAVANERSLNDRKAFYEKAESELNSIFTQVSSMDPRLAIKETDLRKLVFPSHPEHKTYVDGLRQVVDWVRDTKKWDFETVRNLGPKAIFAAYSQEKGWDKERDQKIALQAKTKILAKIKEAAKASSAPDRGSRSVSPMQGATSAGFDRQALVDLLVQNKGESAEYTRLLSANERDPGVMSELFAVYDEAQRRIRTQHS